MLERQIMFKQWQELQRQKKLVELNDGRQQNVMDQQLSLMHYKQSSGTQYPLLNNGIPVRDASQMFMFGKTNLSNRLAQNQAQHSTGLASQQLDGTAMSNESASLLTKHNSEVNNHDRCASSQESGWPGRFSEKMENVGNNQDLASLDPLEQKILFNMEDNIWGTSFGKHGSVGTESYENTDHSSDFPSLQSGSWSALMQSAVAEASSSDAGLQKEWSGSSFKNAELSNENKPSNIVESEKHSTPWLYNKLPKPELISSFPGFQHVPATHFQNPKIMHSDANHQSRKEAGQGFLPDISKNFIDRSAGFPAPNSTGQASHNMLELLHKVDKECSHGRQSGYTNSAPITEEPKAEPDDAFTSSHDNSSRSQCVGLKLAPPSQRHLVNYFDPSQTTLQAGHPSKPFQDPQSNNNRLQNQNCMTNQSPLAIPSYTGSRHLDFSRDISQETSHLVSVKNEDGQQSTTLEAKQHPMAAEMAQQTIWVDVPVQQNLSGMGPCEPSSTSYAANSRMETASEASKGLDYWKYVKTEKNYLETDAHMNSSQGLDDGRGFASKTHIERETLSGNLETSDGSSLLVQGSNREQQDGNHTLPISPGNLEAFGRSLKQADAPPHNHSLVNLTNYDPSRRAVIKIERVTCDDKIPQATSLAQPNSYGNYMNHPGSSAATGDQLAKSSSQPPLQDTSPNIATYNKAPSWLKTHEASNNEQMSMNDAKIRNNASQHLLVGGPPGSLERNCSLVQVASIDQCGSVGPITGTNDAALRHLPSFYSQHLNVANQNMVVLNSKKRKCSTSERLTWHEEVTEGCLGLQDMSIAEMEWAQSVNRLPEKLKEEVGKVAHSLSVVHPKRRLILTTQLMQLLFRPAPTMAPSEDATAHSDTVTYYAARLALGDACSLADHSRTPHCIFGSSSRTSMIPKSFNHLDLSKTVEGFIDRSKRLEDELLRLEKGESSILDVRVEFQDLDRFSIINRFAKFHGRGPLVTADTASSGRASTVPKRYPQRYVTANPMPRVVPEGLHCLSL
ncbi:uncharacterized protein LOC112516407 isoform X1 [Cynara cardunculus var. scolymus]|uniref:uncharacterized protein LOC112516407 isoform X1 n=2 Tax=Cynara cardunculus var. scolymus TaxID=59895 RepID=UPI000D62A99F|nr:uncharacterized protein LOC112516407 isoform X1 [Cynara cardunculus var. scolymus]XP_024979203.1 uncharacterized protein LOC112516407 isoform X1 [Cynara cardunculus var. scolymus]XP_024979211.1 uncharacterized protein LOC112516407 isoform X1 [Cynara cardunculus var. scolymus]XP_024979221.1 uncharacterized protein LOC112516407 isoform X1 [Cynara cardunculus var. scolymus]